MLRDVENAFVTMTTPAWTGVDRGGWTQTEGEKLVGIQADGSAVPVDQMSTGTMGQLYFALRLAGYRSFAHELGPLPMILDDIMETFDDTRTRAALQLCAEIGVNGQATLFTHHAHLVELARVTIDVVAVVNMHNKRKKMIASQSKLKCTTGTALRGITNGSYVPCLWPLIISKCRTMH